MVDGAIVYLKYFQKSKRALRLKREASTSSVKHDRGEEQTKCTWFSEISQKKE